MVIVRQVNRPICKGAPFWCHRQARYVFISSSGRTIIPLCSSCADEYHEWGEYLFPIWVYDRFVRTMRRNIRHDRGRVERLDDSS